MKIAIISVSKKGQELAFDLKNKLDSDSTIIKYCRHGFRHINPIGCTSS